MNNFLNQPPNIPEHKLVRPIGRGGYGEVWLGTNELGSTRAIKIVRRDFFDDERPYEREWKGIIEYEPISRKHDGLISILQVGRNDDEGLFYYVMELADDVNRGDSSDLENYTPHSLKMDMEEDLAFSLEKTFSVMDSLLGALDHLHSNNLVHRDIKPSNILYLEGRPCLADPGLISSMDASLSVVGTIGYMPREGPGRTTGDVFSMGIILYEMMTGNERNSFPELPKSFLSRNSDVVSGLNQSMMKACNDNAQKRYQNAGEFLHDLQGIIDDSRTKELRSKSLPLKIAASIIACISIVLFAWWSNNPNPPESDKGRRDLDYSHTHVHATNAPLHKLDGLESSYEIVTGNFSWHEAKENARKRGGHLAVITSEEENEKIKKLILNHSEEYPHLWAGGTDEVEEGQWVWITGEAWNFDSWFRLTNMPDWPEISEPGNDLGNEHYLQVYREPDPPLKGGIYWNDAPSRPSRNHGYILERGKSEIVEKLIESGREACSREDHDQAMALFKKALEMDPNSFDALFELACLASYVGRELLSLETWDRAIEIHPNDIPARSNRASVLSILKRLDQAENEWKLVIEMDPENAVAHHSIGTFYKDERGDRAKCTMHYKRALEIDPNHQFKSEMIDWLARNRAN